jgi:hypothetical protein
MQINELAPKDLTLCENVTKTWKCYKEETLDLTAPLDSTSRTQQQTNSKEWLLL